MSDVEAMCVFIIIESYKPIFPNEMAASASSVVLLFLPMTIVLCSWNVEPVKKSTKVIVVEILTSVIEQSLKCSKGMGQR